MTHTYQILAIPLVIGLLSLNRGAHSLFCSPEHDPVGDDVMISQGECVNHTVTGIWTASERVETEIEINCFNGTDETGPVSGYERGTATEGNIMAQVSPELEGNVQCVMQGCYEDGDFDTYSIASFSVECVSSEDVLPSPTPTPSPTAQLLLSSTPSPSPTTQLPLSPTPSPSPTTQLPLSSSPAGESSSDSQNENNLTLLYILAPLAVLVAL